MTVSEPRRAEDAAGTAVRTIELLGLPGTGKSTLASALAGRLRGPGGLPFELRSIDPASLRPRRLGTKLGLVAWQVSTSPAASVRAVRAVRASGQRGAAQVVRRSTAWLVAQSLLGAGRPSSVAGRILDEGPLQALWSIGLFGDHVTMLEGWVDQPELWRRADLVIVLDPPLSVVRSRLTGRAHPHSRLEDLGAEERAQALDRGHRVLYEIVESLPLLGVRPEAIVRLDEEPTADRDRDLERAVHRLVEAIDLV
jgi:broad-specificity NMP kinase